ncbi:MAG TPA: hypothetical protein VKZ63_03440, partial [Kofleriaceae bacterium]|nr:hypothetical protein [Kofleriaceae bacterium]
MRHAFTALFIAALAVAASGCPSANHRIRHEQLASLSQAPPETRGQRIEVVQSLGSGDDPPAPAPHVRAGAGVVVYAPV